MDGGHQLLLFVSPVLASKLAPYITLNLPCTMPADGLLQRNEIIFHVSPSTFRTEVYNYQDKVITVMLPKVFS